MVRKKKRNRPLFCAKLKYHLLNPIHQVKVENDIIVQNLRHIEHKVGAKGTLAPELGVQALTQEILIVVSVVDPDQILAGHETGAVQEEDLTEGHVPETHVGAMVQNVAGIATNLVT